MVSLNPQSSHRGHPRTRRYTFSETIQQFIVRRRKSIHDGTMLLIAQHVCSNWHCSGVAPCPFRKHDENNRVFKSPELELLLGQWFLATICQIWQTGPGAKNGRQGGREVVFKARRLLYQSTLGLRVIKKKKKWAGKRGPGSCFRALPPTKPSRSNQTLHFQICDLP